VVDVPLISFGFPLTIAPPSKDTSPFDKPAILLFRKEEPFEMNVMTKFNVLYVNCGITSDFKVTRWASCSVLPVPVSNSRSLDLDRNIQASLSLGLDAAITFEKKVNINLASTKIPEFSIPDIITIRPSISLDSELNLDLAANGSATGRRLFVYPGL
jgi:hypothetical protein